MKLLPLKLMNVDRKRLFEDDIQTTTAKAP